MSKLIGHWNKESGAVWVEDPEHALGRTVAHLGSAKTELAAYDAMAEAGYIRWSNLLPAPAPLFSCSLTDTRPDDGE